MRVVGSSAARVCRITQKASPFPHLGHSAFVFGIVCVSSSTTRVSSPCSFFDRCTFVWTESDAATSRWEPQVGLLQARRPSTGNIREWHFEQNIADAPCGLV